MSVSITIDGKVYEGWLSAKVVRSLEAACSSFSLTATSRELEGSPLLIRPGSSCGVRLDDDLVLSGYVDEVSLSHDAESRAVGITGRSRTQDLVDCCVVNEGHKGQFAKLPLLQIARTLAQPYGVEVVSEVPDMFNVEKHVVQSGETVFDSIEKLAKGFGLLVTDDPQGRMVLTRAGSLRALTKLELGRNILSAVGKFDASALYSEIRAKGMKRGSDFAWGTSTNEALATVEDDTVARRRVLIVSAESTADAKRCIDRAIWESATRHGASIALEITVPGWRQADGSLWTPNSIVQVSDPLLAVEGEFLLVEVEYSLDNDSGETTLLKLAPVEAFQMLPPEQRKKGRGKAKTKTLFDRATGKDVTG